MVVDGRVDVVEAGLGLLVGGVARSAPVRPPAAAGRDPAIFFTSTCTKSPGAGRS
jgi:hypothetical protein